VSGLRRKGWPAVRGARAYGGVTARTRGASGRGCVGARVARAAQASGGARPREAQVRMPVPVARGRRRAARGARDVAACWRSALTRVAGVVFELIFLQFFV
jgi:hypothetical protein